MMQLFASRFATSVHYAQSTASSRFDLAALREVCRASSKAGMPVVVMGTSFAFVHVTDELGDERLDLAPGSRAMHTGGFKGKSREVEPEELRSKIAHVFGIPTAAVVGEYGMTELSSQLYEGTLRASGKRWLRLRSTGSSSPRRGCAW